MTPDILTLAGGVGLFLLGMQIMTGALRHLANRRMRLILSRFTTSPLTGTATGALTTAVIQSSSATMVTVIGFVGAGMMAFPQALGVIYGANIGTTITGWIVALVGLKLQIGLIALPLLLAAVLAHTVLRGSSARVALAVAGFALVFIGLEMMQEAAEGFKAFLSADRLPGDTVSGRLWLVLAGAAVTVVIQSSSAGIAAALVLVGAGSISLEQGAALVIGMNIGTTVTALLASVGGTRDMLRTALAHFAYNAITAVAALALLGLVVPGLGRLFWGEAATALVVFHTLFNVLGAALMLPFTHQFAALIQRLVPSDAASLTAALHRSLLDDPRAAMDAASSSAIAIAGVQFSRLGTALHPSAPQSRLSGVASRIDPALDELRDYVTQIHVPPEQTDALTRRAALMHLVDHLGRLNERIKRDDRMAPLLHDPLLRRPALVLGAAARRVGVADSGMSASKMTRIRDRIANRAARVRRSALLREHVGMIEVSEVFELTASMRWLQHSADHAARILFYLEAAQTETPGTEPGVSETAAQAA